ncbi:MAG: hypothetical protein H7Y32_16665 [Chloroflexales bacterium]|nr:hypothetical protein [Chloroflexales bacterium]
MRFLGLHWPVWGALCLVVAAIYLVVWPQPKDPAVLQAMPLWRFVVLRWFHGGLWLLLALSCFVRGVPQLGGVALANPLAIAAGLMYAVFIVATVQGR